MQPTRAHALVSALSLLLLSTSPVFAQAAPVAPEGTEGGAKKDPADVACAGAAAYSAGSGPQVHVVRRGSMSLQNALRPLSGAAPVVVLQVTISGKVATAHGPGFEEMRRGGPPQQLEEESGSRIMWDKNLGALPRTILIVGDDRSEPIARLRFVACTNVPKVAPAGDRAVRTRGPNAGAKPPEQAPTRALPQGAIQ
jgi:hypothetical protein